MSTLDLVKHRLAFALGSSVREMEDRIGHDEWCGWLKFHEHYDFPDGFYVAGILSAAISQAVSGKGDARDSVAYYQAFPRDPLDGARGWINFLKSNALKRRRKSEGPPGDPGRSQAPG